MNRSDGNAEASFVAEVSRSFGPWQVKLQRANAVIPGNKILRQIDEAFKSFTVDLKGRSQPFAIHAQDKIIF